MAQSPCGIALVSKREGLPRSLIEAAACARPIIATDVTGCRDVVSHSKTGLLVPPGDIEAAANAIVLLASDAGLREKLGAAGEARMRATFSESIVSSQIGAVYEQLIPLNEA